MQSYTRTFMDECGKLLIVPFKEEMLMTLRYDLQIPSRLLACFQRLMIEMKQNENNLICLNSNGIASIVWRSNKYFLRVFFVFYLRDKSWGFSRWDAEYLRMAWELEKLCFQFNGILRKVFRLQFGPHTSRLKPYSREVRDCRFFRDFLLTQNFFFDCCLILKMFFCFLGNSALHWNYRGFNQTIRRCCHSYQMLFLLYKLNFSPLFKTSTAKSFVILTNFMLVVVIECGRITFDGIYVFFVRLTFCRCEW